MNLAAANRPYWAGMLCVLATSVGWGLNWPVMKYLLQECPPLLARGSSGMLAALAFWLLARAAGERRTARETPAASVLLAALFNVSAWMGLSTVSLYWLSAGQGALLVYTMPVWAMIWAWALRGARPALQALLGLGVSMLGLAVLFGSGNGAGMPLPGVLFALGAALLFALGSVILKPPADIPPFTLLAWQLGAGSVPVLAFGIWFEPAPARAISPLGWALLAYMTLVPMGLCYLSWFAALRRLPPTVASAATMLTPIIGACAGAVFLGEAFGATEIAAVGLTVAGVLLVLLQRRARS